MADWERLTPGAEDTESVAFCLQQHGMTALRMGCVLEGKTLLDNGPRFVLGDPELNALATKSDAWAKREAEVQTLAKAYQRLVLNCDALQCQLDLTDPDVKAARAEIDLASDILAPFKDSNVT